MQSRDESPLGSAVSSAIYKLNQDKVFLPSYICFLIRRKREITVPTPGRVVRIKKADTRKCPLNLAVIIIR